MKHARVLVIAVLAVLALTGVSVPRAQQGEARSVARLREDVRKAANPAELNKAYEALFDGVGRYKLPDLIQDDDLGVAVHAAWAYNKATYQRRGTWLAPTEVVAPERAERFLGFLEGRTRLKIPLWWDMAFADPFLNLKSDDSDFHQTGLGGLGIRAPIGTELVKKGDRIVVTVHSSVEANRTASVTIDESVLDQLEEYQAFEKCAAQVKPEESFLAFYTDLGSRFPLIAVDSHSGKVLWRAEVWSRDAAFGGVSDHVAEIVVNDNFVAVFGICVVERYVEAFDRKTGACVFRFKYP